MSVLAAVLVSARPDNAAAQMPGYAQLKPGESRKPMREDRTLGAALEINGLGHVHVPDSTGVKPLN
jgi:hypothetical protein